MVAYALGNGGFARPQGCLAEAASRPGRVVPRFSRSAIGPHGIAQLWPPCPCGTAGGHAHVGVTRASGDRQKPLAGGRSNDKQAECGRR